MHDVDICRHYSVKKTAFDLWADAVNTASRMQSNGIPGFIQASYSTYNLLKDKYLFDRRGPINIKGNGDYPAMSCIGKGDMQPYVLVGRHVYDENGSKITDEEGRPMWIRVCCL